MLSWVTSVLLAAYAAVPFQTLAPHNSVANSVTGLMQVVGTTATDTTTDPTKTDSDVLAGDPGTFELKISEPENTSADPGGDPSSTIQPIPVEARVIAPTLAEPLPIAADEQTSSTEPTPPVSADSAAVRVLSAETASTSTIRSDTSVSTEQLIQLNTATRRVESATRAIEQDSRAPVTSETIRRAVMEKPRETVGVERAIDEAKEIVEQTPVAPALQEREIRDAVTRREPSLRQVRTDLAERDGLSLYTDSDDDGVSDYDEIHIYHTDPHNPRTVPGALTDGQKILRGIDPLSESTATVPVASPRASGVQVSGLFEVQTMRSVTLTGQTEADQRASSTSDTAREHTGIVFEGRALPNSFVTLYIFSTPVVVTVKADSSGRWSYQLDQELEDGSHELYVAMVDNSGAIIAKSAPVPFTKQAEALEYAPLVLPPIQEADLRDIVTKHFIVTGILVLFVLAFLAILGIGVWRLRRGVAVAV